MSQPRRSRTSNRFRLPEIAGIGERFAERRIELGLTQQMLADLAGVSRYSIQALEHGTGSVKLASVVEIAAILGLRLRAVTVDSTDS